MKSQTNWSLLAGLRFVLALIVAGGHLTWIDRGVLSSTFDSFGPKAAVIGFLLVSGYSIAASLDRDPASFYLRRFKRIYPIYFVSVVSAIALELWLGTYALPHHTFEPTGLLTNAANLLMLQTFVVKPIAFDGVVWSLALEASYYLITPILERRSLYVWAVLISVSVAFFILPRGFDGGQLYGYALKANAIKYFWPFAMGFILYRHWSARIAAISATACAALVLASNDTRSDLCIATISFSFAVLFCARTFAISPSRFLDYLGDISYPLYLVQIPVYVFAYRIAGLTNTTILMLFAIATACAIYELIDVRLKPLIFVRFRARANRTTPAAAYLQPHELKATHAGHD